MTWFLWLEHTICNTIFFFSVNRLPFYTISLTPFLSQSHHTQSPIANALTSSALPPSTDNLHSQYKIQSHNHASDAIMVRLVTLNSAASIPYFPLNAAFITDLAAFSLSMRVNNCRQFLFQPSPPTLLQNQCIFIIVQTWTCQDRCNNEIILRHRVANTKDTYICKLTLYAKSIHFRRNHERTNWNTNFNVFDNIHDGLTGIWKQPQTISVLQLPMELHGSMFEHTQTNAVGCRKNISKH